MTLEFDIKLTPRDMYRFNMYQTYSGVHGWLSVLAAVLLFAMAGRTYGEVKGMYTGFYIIFGCVLLFYLPFTLYVRSKHSIAASEVLQGSLHYTVGEDGFVVSQGEANAELKWEQIYRMVATKHNVLVYSNRIHAYVIPRAQLKETYGALAALATAKLPKHRVKMSGAQQVKH